MKTLGGYKCTCSPVWDIFALWWEFEDPGVAVAIWDIDVSSNRVHGHICRLAEMFLVTSWFKGFSQNQKQPIFTITAQFEYLYRGKKVCELHSYAIYTALQKFGNALEKKGFGQYQHKSLLFFGANTLK